MRKNIQLIVICILFAPLFIAFKWPWDSQKIKPVDIVITETGGAYNLNNKFEINSKMQGVFYIDQEKIKDIQLKEIELKKINKVLDEYNFNKFNESYKLKNEDPSNVTYSISLTGDDKTKIVAVNGLNQAPKGFYEIYSCVKQFFYPSFSHASDYEWVSGELFNVKQGKGYWGIVFNKSLPENDYNGRFLLLDFIPSEDFKQGDIVLARGNILGDDNQHKVNITSYGVKTIERL